MPKNAISTKFVEIMVKVCVFIENKTKYNLNLRYLGYKVSQNMQLNLLVYVWNFLSFEQKYAIMVKNVPF